MPSTLDIMAHTELVEGEIQVCTDRRRIGLFCGLPTDPSSDKVMECLRYKVCFDGGQDIADDGRLCDAGSELPSVKLFQCDGCGGSFEGIYALDRMFCEECARPVFEKRRLVEHLSTPAALPAVLRPSPPRLTNEVETSGEASEDHTASPNVSPHEPNEFVAAVSVSSPNVQMRSSVRKAVARGPVEIESLKNAPNATHNEKWENSGPVTPLESVPCEGALDPLLARRNDRVSLPIPALKTVPSLVSRLSVAHAKKDPWRHYPTNFPKLHKKAPGLHRREERKEPLPLRAREGRRTPLHNQSYIPDHVKNAKIAKQNGRCVFCQRLFGSPVLHDSPDGSAQVEILKPQAEHLRSRAAGGRTSDSNIHYACHVCNRLKSDFVFDSIHDATTWLQKEWSIKGYADCPPLITFRRTIPVCPN